MRRLLTWDADKLFPATEQIDGLPNLVWEVTSWDKTLGVPLEIEDPSGRAQQVELDGLGRVTGTFAGFVGALVRLTTTVYVLTGMGAVPRIESTVHEGGLIPDVVSAAVFNALGEPRYGAVLEAGSTWITDAHRTRNELGLTSRSGGPTRL